MYHIRKNEKQSRIDFWLISSSLDNFANVEHLNPNWSDHRAVALTLQKKNYEKGNGMWKMNSEVIKSRLFREAFTIFWHNWQNCKTQYRDIQTWWDLGKIKIKQMTQDIAGLIAKDNREAEHHLNDKINRLQKANPNDPTLENLKDKQKQFYEKKGLGAKIRSRVRYEEEGEKCTRYFHALEEKNGGDKMWDKIIDTDGTTYTDLNNIQRIQLNFYQDLYTASGNTPDINDENLFLNAIHK